MSWTYGFNILYIDFTMKIGTLSHLLEGPWILSLALRSLGKGVNYKEGLLVCIKQELGNIPSTQGWVNSSWPSSTEQGARKSSLLPSIMMFGGPLFMKTPLSCSLIPNLLPSHLRSSCSMRESLTQLLDIGPTLEKLRNITMLTMGLRCTSMADGGPNVPSTGLLQMHMTEYLIR